jgi:hypothetical protein
LGVGIGSWEPPGNQVTRRASRGQVRATGWRFKSSLPHHFVVLAALPQERLVERLFGVLMDDRGDTDEGGAGMMVPAPHRPSPHDSAIALALPVEDEDE